VRILHEGGPIQKRMTEIPGASCNPVLNT